LQSIREFLLSDLKRKYVSGSRKNKIMKESQKRGFKTEMLKKTNLIRTMYNFVVKKKILYSKEISSLIKQ